jgi:hypothetical protein
LANGLTKICTVPEAPNVYANQRPSGEIVLPMMDPDSFSKGSVAPALGWSGSVASMVRLCSFAAPGFVIRTNRPSGETEVGTCPI